MATLHKITPCLWYDGQAEEAANFYVSLFPDSRITGVQRYSEAEPSAAGSVMVVTFELAGQPLIGLNGGPQFHFTEAISLQIGCDSQEEVDELWGKLTADGGEESQCGWLKDRYGLSWQVVPRRLFELLEDPDAGRVTRVTQRMYTMRKIEIASLEEAAKA
ncbi:VOC family protein [Streptomyces boncukensis]|uniref:VOC family protein n=1 Tax=Streptomyces boncukensis TaxID=2711219 RepID=A0A6G4WW55_9ACTN|nr:VOC family protein [Streptomyces boncukensis]NGO69516.1 VOC family protein [Streptomyces boncukensis]